MAVTPGSLAASSAGFFVRGEASAGGPAPHPKQGGSFFYIRVIRVDPRQSFEIRGM